MEISYTTITSNQVSKQKDKFNSLAQIIAKYVYKFEVFQCNQYALHA